MKVINSITIMLSTALLLSCNGSKRAVEAQPDKPVKMERTGNMQAGPPTVVYRTVDNFDDNVPVTMNASKTEIVSYPDPSDVGEYSRPTHLKNGYLLDNRGINENAAFLKYTYAEYARLPQPPSLAELKANIKELYPLTELVYCGLRYQYANIVDDLNAVIDAGFPGCRRADVVPRVMLRE